MSVKLDIRQIGDVYVVDVAGRVTLGEGSSTLRNTLREMVAKGQKKILLNLGEVSYIDSSGVGEIGDLGPTMVARAGGKLLICQATDRVDDLLQITKLIEAFKGHDIRASVGDAIRGFTTK